MTSTLDDSSKEKIFKGVYDAKAELKFLPSDAKVPTPPRHFKL